jgi:hypothetical protein
VLGLLVYVTLPRPKHVSADPQNGKSECSFFKAQQLTAHLITKIHNI